MDIDFSSAELVYNPGSGGRIGSFYAYGSKLYATDYDSGRRETFSIVNK